MICRLCTDKPDANLDVDLIMKSLISNDADYVIPECIQGITETTKGPVTEQSFIVVIGQVNTVSENHVAMALLDQPFNFGKGAEEIRFICLVLCPSRTKHTKSAVQVARTYATLLADERLRHNLLNTHSPAEFAQEFEVECTRVHRVHQIRRRELTTKTEKSEKGSPVQEDPWFPGRDLGRNIKNRAKHYISDFTHFKDRKSIPKIISSTLFLYFSLLLPGIAFGVLDYKNTGGYIDARKVVISQGFSSIAWAILSGQPLVVVRTTIPMVIYTKIIYTVSLNWEENGSFFPTFYAMVGIVNSLFLILYGVTGASKIMIYCSRSTEEIVGMFISIAFLVDSCKFIKTEFDTFYCFAHVNTTRTVEELALCDPQKPLLALLLILITVYVGVQIFNFKYSPYLNADKRVLVADYALVVAVIASTALGSYVFKEIHLETFKVAADATLFKFVDFKAPSTVAVFSSIGLGFVMSILIFMEGNISESVVNNPANKLRKGSAFHLDMFVTGLINAVLSLFCLPWVHGSLPHSPLHVRGLADIEERIENGHLKENVVYVRETRLTNLVSGILIGVSVLLIPHPLNLIPIPVFYGIFVYLAITSLEEFQMWERFVLIFTEQTLYPPLHYVRRVPQKIIHCFTLLQLLQLAALCLVSFGGSTYLKMFFPFVIILLMPIRERILPALISERHLTALDGVH
eukprot:sb/3462655/